MAYEHEREEWRSALHGLSEMERAHNEAEPRRSLGIVGQPEDALYGT